MSARSLRGSAGPALFFGLFACACGADDAGPHGGAGAGAGGAANTGGASSGGSGGALATAGSTSGGANGSNGGSASSGSASGGSASGGSAAGGVVGAGGTSPTAGTNGVAGSGGAASGAGPFKGVANSECADLTTLSVAWWYNWELGPKGCNTAEFVPMISGKNEKTAVAVTNALSQLSSAGYDTVLGFNEPNKVDQSNLTVDQVLDLWPSITSNAAVRVGSPATSADAKAWFEQFMTQVEAQSLRVDFVAVHWYGWNAGSCNDANELESYVEWAEQFERPIWLTEWGCMNQSNPSPEVVQGFYAAAIAMFEEHPLIERYAWYPWLANNELMSSGQPTVLGQAFAAAPSTR